MLTIVLRAVVPYIVMFCAAYLATSLVFASKVRKGYKPHATGKHAKTDKMGVMDTILIIELIAIVLYVTVDFWIFYRVGAEPSSLTISFFGVCGTENGVMGWIKTRKEQERMRRWSLEDQDKASTYVEDKHL